MSRILLNFIFDFPATLFITKDCSFTLILMPTSLVFKLLCILSTSFLAYDSLVKVVQLFKRFPMIYSRTIFRKKNSTLWGPGFKISHFRFSSVAEAVCTPTMAACVFFSSYYPVTKIKCFLVR